MVSRRAASALLVGRRAASALFVAVTLVGLASPASAQDFHVAPYVQDTTPSRAWILWETSSGEESAVAFGTSMSLGERAAGTTQPSVGAIRLHEVELTGLLPATRYFYRAETGSAMSEIAHFTTPPARDADTPFRIVAMSDMQIDRANPDVYRQVVHDGIIDFATTTFGPELDTALAFVLVPGDLVDDGRLYESWATEFFAPGAALMANVPFYPVLGNHENDSEHYYRYFHLPANGSVEHPDQWWAMDYANVRVIGLDSNLFLLVGEQADFFEDAVREACTDDTIDFVFVSLHHAHRSELWRTGETPLTSTVVERMNRFSTECGKPSVHFYGHTHGYSRGESRDASHLWVNVASAGGNIDYWGEYADQRDVAEVSVSQDEWGFVLVDVTPGTAPSFRVRRYSRGNELTPRDNALRDDITVRRFNELPSTPVPSMPRGRVRAECNTLAASGFVDSDGDLHGATHWQISERCDDFTRTTAEHYRGHENWYGGLDTQASDDLSDEPIDGLVAGRFYCWRVRYRDRALAWSAWSTPTAFLVDPAGVGVAERCSDPASLEMPVDLGPTPPPPPPPPPSAGCDCQLGASSRARQPHLVWLALALLGLAGGVRMRTRGQRMRRMRGQRMPRVRGQRNTRCSAARPW